MKSRATACLLAASWALQFAGVLPAFATGTSAVATTEGGSVRGANAEGFIAFRGIPCARAPVGELRWQAPQRPAPWSGVKDARNFGPACSQPARSPNNRRPDGLGAAPQATSEDCLSLNVWTPRLPGKAPVMVWLHGGAHRFGAGSVPFYDGVQCAKHGVLLVSINYRLGLLGYFAHPALTAAAAGSDALGNYGLMEQLAALHWVQRNFAAFGGDPSNVTVFGESAGGASILYLLATHSAQGLFAKAIVQSGGGWQRSLTLTQKEQEGVAAAHSAGLTGEVAAAQLRKLSVGQLTEAIKGVELLNLGPFVDGRLVTASPA